MLTYTNAIIIAVPFPIFATSLDKCPRGSVTFNKNGKKKNIFLLAGG